MLLIPAMTSAKATNSKHIVFVAGEASGDHHGAALIKALHQHHPDWRLSGIGGEAMTAQGMSLIANLAKYGVVGFTEVIRHFKVIRRAFKQLEAHLKAEKPDLLVLIDYPGFNLRMARVAKRLGIKVLYYISPQIWAWKKKRINIIKQYVDRMAVILPFEVDIYRKANVLVEFVGHPLTQVVRADKTEGQFRHDYNIADDKRIIVLLPGSRNNEIKRLLPVMLASAQQLKTQRPELHFVLPLASTIDQQALKHTYQTAQYDWLSIINGDTYNAIHSAHSVIACSGTVTLETALLHKPMVIIYQLSPVSYFIASRFINIRFIGLCNILANRLVVPELIQQNANADNICQHMLRYLNDEDYYFNTQQQLAEVHKQLRSEEQRYSIEQWVIDAVDSSPN